MKIYPRTAQFLYLCISKPRVRPWTLNDWTKQQCMMGLCGFQGDLNGHKGLVPSNFLQAFPETEEDAARTEHTVTESRRDSQVRVCVYVCVFIACINVDHCMYFSFYSVHHWLTALVSPAVFCSACRLMCVCFYFCMVFRSTGEVFTLNSDRKCFIDLTPPAANPL